MSASAATLLTSTPKSEVRARRPLTRTAAAPAEIASPAVVVTTANNNAKASPEREKEASEPAPSGVATRHSARIANKLREVSIRDWGEVAGVSEKNWGGW